MEGVMIIVAGTIRIPTDKLNEAREHMARVLPTSRTEPGCVLYSFAHDVLEPGLIRVFEMYRDQGALDSHRETDHFKAWRASNPGIGVHDRQINVYNPPAAR